jgi:hypothetical protein
LIPINPGRAVADPDERVSAKQLALGLPKHAWISFRDLVDIAKMRWRIERDSARECRTCARSRTHCSSSRTTFIALSFGSSAIWNPRSLKVPWSPT